METTLDSPDWKEFEIAVARFVEALDPQSRVTHDVKLPDIHTNTLRQRDVWIEARVCQHFPIKVLISCKRRRRKLSQQDIDAFIGELDSSGANLGVIYSYSGFSDNAVIKAKELQISCCRLYRNEPPDIPNSIILLSSYLCKPRMSLSVVAPLDSSWGLRLWRDLFLLEFKDDGDKISALDAIVKSYLKGEAGAKQNLDGKSMFPTAWARLLELAEDSATRGPIRILVNGLWNIYEGRVEAHLLEGSYNFTSEEFIGSQSGPVIDLYSSHPGPGWRLLDEIPTPESPKGFIRSVCILSGGNAKEALLENLGPKEIAIQNLDLS